MRVGGLCISRRPGEAFVMVYPPGTGIVNRYVWRVTEVAMGAITLECDGYPLESHVLRRGDSVGLRGMDAETQTGVYVDSVEGGRTILRIIADDKIRIIREEIERF